MRCEKCGARISKKSDFCSKCGEAVNSVTSTQLQNVNSKNAKNEKIINLLIIISIVFFSFFFFISIVCNAKFCAFIALIQIVLSIITLLIKKEKIKLPQKKLHIILPIIALVLIFPYIISLGIATENTKEFVWSDVILNDILPEPKSNKGEIITNSENNLYIEINETSVDDYKEYLSECEGKGFIIEADKAENIYAAFNKDGYKLDLSYENGGKKMCIDVEAPMKLGEIKWSESEIAKLLPVPEFEFGKIEKDDVSEFSLYFSGISYDSYTKYVNECSQNGFNVDSTKTEKAFSTKNSDDYSLTVDYKGNSIVYLSIKEPEYNININVEYTSELFDSDYDVDIYADNDNVGTITHGNTDTFDSILNKGIHTIKFVNADDNSICNEIKVKINKQETLKFKITCNDDKIDIETLSGDIEIQVKSINFSDTSDINFYYSYSSENNSFSVETNPESKITDNIELLDFVSENPKIASIEYEKNSSYTPRVIITPIANGETYVYIQSKDGTVQSEKIKVVVDIEKETTQNDTDNSTYEEETTKKKSGKIVYVTPSGEKYHYSKSCAGKNAMERDLDDIKGIYDPCKKCAG